MPAYLCPHCATRSSFGNAGAGAQGSDGIFQMLRCAECRGIVFARVEGQGKYTFLHPPGRDAAPDDYPADVRDNFTEALRSLQVGNHKAAVIMTRSALQGAMRDQNAKGANLKQEIDDLAAKHLLPPAVQEWAHEIRDGGNLVAHPELGKRVEKEDGDELLSLAETIFEYLYVIPAQVQARRQRRAQQGGQGTA